LVYLDDGENVGCDTKGIKSDGQFHDSKLMWALGNYSRFVRPGMVRVKCDLSEPQSMENGLLVSAYKDPASGKLVYVMVNLSKKDQLVDLGFNTKVEVYTTSEGSSLGMSVAGANRISIPGRSVSTVVHTNN
jgi:hypothetical protein